MRESLQHSDVFMLFKDIQIQKEMPRGRSRGQSPHVSRIVGIFNACKNVVTICLHLL